jgi:hypothetical protein
MRAAPRAANQVLVEDAPAIATIRGEAPTTLGDTRTDGSAWEELQRPGVDRIGRRASTAPCRESAPQICLLVGLSPG